MISKLPVNFILWEQMAYLHLINITGTCANYIFWHTIISMGISVVS